MFLSYLPRRHLSLSSFPTRRSSDLEGAREGGALVVHVDQGGHGGQRLALGQGGHRALPPQRGQDRKSTRLNSSHVKISYAVFCLKKKNPTVRGDSARNTKTKT